MARVARWRKGFLVALERCGRVREAAALAGVDFSTAYQARKRDPDFAGQWQAALCSFRQGDGGGEESVGEGAEQGDCAAPAASGRNGRWTAAAEKKFFAALADQANVKRAAEAAGFSTQAVYARRLKRPDFRKHWEAAVETGKARLQMMLMDAAEKSFDPDLLEVPDEAPKVSISEALNIIKVREGKERELSGTSGRGWIGDPAWDHQESYDEQCDRIIDRLQRLGQQIRDEKEAQGWGWDEEHQQVVPPGWAKPEAIKIERGGPRGGAQWSCPHCGVGLNLTLPGGSA